MQEIFEVGKVYEISIIDLHPDPNQPRKHFDPNKIEYLKQSIAKHGLLQPVCFRKDGDGRYFLVSGERRYRSCRDLGHATILARFTSGDPMEVALVENLVREDLTPIEQAESLSELKAKHKYNHEQLGNVIGKARNTVTEILSLNKLPLEFRDICRHDTRFALRELKKISGKRDAEKQKQLFEVYKRKLDDKAANITRPRSDKLAAASKRLEFIASFLKGIETWNFAEKDVVRSQLEEISNTIRQIIKKPGGKKKDVDASTSTQDV